MNAKALEFLYHLEGAAKTSLPWAQIWQWIVTYGWPIVEQILAALLPLLLGGKLDPVVINWVTGALAAVKSGKMTIAEIIKDIAAYEANGTLLPATP